MRCWMLLDADGLMITAGWMHEFRCVRVLTQLGGDLQVRTRLGECAIGWAPFYANSMRASCMEGPSCKPIGELFETFLLTDAELEPYRCCAKFSPEYVRPWGICALPSPVRHWMPSSAAACSGRSRVSGRARSRRSVLCEGVEALSVSFK